jgi:hypothetical protein
MNSKKVLIIAIVLIVLVLAVILGIFFFYRQPAINPSLGGAGQKIVTKTPPPIAQAQAQTNKDYPITVDGIINFFDTKNSFKATIKTSDGKEYILYPPQPEAIYGSLGIKAGQKVELRVKALDTARLEWGSIKPI